MVKRQWREAKHIPASSAETKSEWRYKAIPPYVVMAGTGTNLPSPYTQIRHF
jgi:hypothetical protein